MAKTPSTKQTMKSFTSCAMKSAKKSTLTLTPDLYFTPKNTAISNSKVSDFLKSKEYFFKKHIEHSLPKVHTVPMKVGSIVDSLLCGEIPQYQVKVLKKDDPNTFAEQKHMDPDMLVTETQWRTAQNAAQAVTGEAFYQWYMQNKAEFQVLLQANYKGVEICGMADVVTRLGDIAYIDDFKVVSQNKVTSEKTWYWNCMDYGYFRQLAVYRFMLMVMFPEIKSVVCRHVAIGKPAREEEPFKIRLYQIHPVIIDLALKEFLNGVEAIDKEKDWVDPPITWNDIITITPQNDVVEMSVDDFEDMFEE